MADRIKFYMDEHIPKAVTAGLRRRGVDVLTAQEAGLHPAEDGQHLALAISEGRVIFTQDADFLRLHAATSSSYKRLRFINAKRLEWDDYRLDVTPWELRKYLPNF